MTRTYNALLIASLAVWSLLALTGSNGEALALGCAGASILMRWGSYTRATLASRARWQA